MPPLAHNMYDEETCTYAAPLPPPSSVRSFLVLSKPSCCVRTKNARILLANSCL